ncbi:MAG TPA: tagatose 1,6-diphosphate aldolase [Terriglobales bacterium]|nr:tagatose 1,6-diphosphate aldolase [Terriglobales bacterium]
MTIPKQSKTERLRSLSNADGVIAALAMDQRRSLRKLIANAASGPFEEIADSKLVEFKTAVTQVLTSHASAILLDPEYGLEAAEARAKNCGLLLAYEADGYENPRPNRMLALMPEHSVRTLRDAGSSGIKILLHYSPLDDDRPNLEKRILIERIGNECEALGMPFFLEPVLYDPVPAGKAPMSDFAFAKAKPALVIELMREFSRDIYKVDILKVEFPVVPTYVQGSAVHRGETAYTMDEALDSFRAADKVAHCPYIYLSAGVSTPVFLESLRMANESGARYSGVLCGRATWQDGVSVYATQGVGAFRKWLETQGAANLERLNQLLRSAIPWQQRLQRA